MRAARRQLLASSGGGLIENGPGNQRFVSRYVGIGE